MDHEVRTFQFRKLVRSGVLESMIQNNQRVNAEYLTGQRHLEAMEDKFREETDRLSLAKGSEQALNELADIQQLIDDSLTLLGQTPEDLARVQAEKRNKAGDFLRGAFVRTVEVDSGIDPDRYTYFIEHPDCYPTQLD
ncbi:hypothetical protein KC968_00205 [Candidatus Saccharibacteria bacterium]|nr:hypothetical protein [Candidatus Saccharibacteria bacterium]